MFLIVGSLKGDKIVKTTDDSAVAKRFRLIVERFAEHLGSKQEFARAINISPSKLSIYMSGGYLPSSETLQRIAKIGVNVHWLLTGEGEMMIEQDFDDGTISQIEDMQSQLIDLNNKFAEFLRTKYAGSAAAGRLPKQKEDDDGD